MTNPTTPQGVTLRETLEPFAKLFQALQSKHDGPMPTTFEAIISTEDVRRAAYAFADLSHPPAPEQSGGKQAIMTAEQISEVNDSLWAELDEIKDKTGYNEYREANRGLGHWTLLGYLLNLKHRAATPTAEPQGWKLVPVEPTDTMLVRGSCAMCGDRSEIEQLHRGWNAMLSASPAAPEAAKPDQEDEEAPSLSPSQYAEFWERLPGHLIDNHEGEELTEELLQRAAADLYAKFPALVESGLQPFGLLLLEERATTRQLTRALREATEAPTFMGEPVVAAKPEQQAQAGEPITPVYGVIDPDYVKVYTQARIVAWQYGYACLMHGSLTRDLDLLLVPWTDQAHNNHEQMLKLIAAACGLRFRDGKEEVYESEADWTDKSHGRKACSLFFRGFGDRRWVDISVLPVGFTKKDAALKACVEALESTKGNINTERGFADEVEAEIAAAITQAEGAMK